MTMPKNRTEEVAPTSGCSNRS